MFFKDKAKSGESELTVAEAPVSKALILICEKCGKKLASKEDENPSRTLQQNLKETIRSIGAKGQLRSVITGCMDVCPDDQIAVTIVSPSEKPKFFTLSGDFQSGVQKILNEAK